MAEKIFMFMFSFCFAIKYEFYFLIISLLSFLLQVVIFLVLGMTDNFFYCILDILSVMLGGSGFYITLF